MGKNADQEKATLAKKFTEHLKTENNMRWKEIQLIKEKFLPKVTHIMLKK